MKTEKKSMGEKIWVRFYSELLQILIKLDQYTWHETLSLFHKSKTGNGIQRTGMIYIMTLDFPAMFL